MRLANLVPPEAMPYATSPRSIRQRRLSRGGAPRGRRASISTWRESAQRQAQARWPPIGVGFSDLLRAGRARHLGLSTAGASRWCRATSSALRACTPDGVLELRIGAHSHGQGMETTLAQVAQRDPRHRSRRRCASDPWRHGVHALFHRHLGLALHGDVGRRRGGSLRRDRRPREGTLLRSSWKLPPPTSCSQDGCVYVAGNRPQAWRSPRSPTSGIARRSSCPRTSIPRAWK